MLNDDVEVRANGARLLADVMHGLPSGCLNNAEGMVPSTGVCLSSKVGLKLFLFSFVNLALRRSHGPVFL